MCPLLHVLVAISLFSILVFIDHRGEEVSDDVDWLEEGSGGQASETRSRGVVDVHTTDLVWQTVLAALDIDRDSRERGDEANHTGDDRKILLTIRVAFACAPSDASLDIGEHGDEVHHDHTHRPEARRLAVVAEVTG
jgi:hypothetical protein